MNGWDYLHSNPVGAVVLVVVVGWALARLVRAFRDRRPVRVRLALRCPDCERETEPHDCDGGTVQ